MENEKVSRRDFVCKGTAAGLAATVGTSAASASAAEADTAKDSQVTEDQGTLAGGMPYGKIGDLKIGRLIFGSNTPGAEHSRDLIYVSSLGKAYNTRERMLDTYELAESVGINTVLQGGGWVKEYNTTRGGNLRTISPFTVNKDDDKESIKRKLTGAMRNPLAAAWYIWGDRGDYLAMAKRMDLVGTAMDVAKELGAVLGLGGHSLEVPIQCEALGIKPDFYVKTFHDDNYWSATPKENREPFCWYDDSGGNSYSGRTGEHNRFHDNIWCLDPQKTIEVMRKVEAPWIAFKVLAAGAVHPKQGFGFAFRNGADFVAVGMLDFQVRENAALVKRYATRLKDRDRPWRG